MKQIEKRNWNFNNASVAYVFAILGYFCASIILTIIVLAATAGAIATYPDSANDILTLPWVTYLNIILSELSFLLVFLICNKKYKKEFFVANRIKFKPNALIIIGTILGAAVLFFGSMNSSELFTHLFSTFAKETPELAVPLDNFGQFILAVFLLAILPAVCEELLFRGLIFNGLKSKLKAPWAILLSATLFALMHMSIYQTLHQFVLGVVLATLVYFTGTVVYSMIFHFINNFLVIFLAYTFPNATFTFATWGTKEVLIALALFILALWIVALLFYILRERNKKQALNTNNPKQLSWQEIIASYQQSCDLYELSDENSSTIETKEDVTAKDKKLAKDNLQSSHDDNTLGIILLSVSVAVAMLMWILNSF